MHTHTHQHPWSTPMVNTYAQLLKSTPMVNTNNNQHKVNVQVKYLESMSVEEAAGVFDDATVVIWQHGAAMTNLVFMPEGASGIQVCV